MQYCGHTIPPARNLMNGTPNHHIVERQIIF